MNARAWIDVIRKARRSGNPVVGYQVQYAVGSGFYIGASVNEQVFDKARRIYTLHAKPEVSFTPLVFHGTYWLQPSLNQQIPPGFRAYYQGHEVYSNTELQQQDELDLITRRLILCGHNENEHGQEKETAEVHPLRL